ncbi:MAG: transglutaminase domain-containing protein [Verrucomicrobia bacterium]|nr:MAG: transglutaminase domain-containing protein [Verrucomicrobiota bacterium]
MKPPPLLLGVTLLFWGWQSDLLLPGALMTVVLESAHVFKTRWDFSDDDFTKTWSFCSLVLLAAVVYSFTNNDGPSSFTNMFEDLSLSAHRSASTASARTAAQVIRWLPMIFFPFLVAQTFSTRESIPLATISLILQRRWKKAKSLGLPSPISRGFSIVYPYFCATLLAASFHPSDDNSFFWGFCVLLTWVLWTQRSHRFAVAVWFGVLAVAVAIGFFGQRGASQAQAYLTNKLNSQWFANLIRRSENPYQSRTSMGIVGKLKLSDRIVIRLQPNKPKNIPAYLREASYRLYRDQTWFGGSPREDFISTTEEQPTGSGNWTLLTGKSVISSISIACYLEDYDKGAPSGLLPLPIGTTRLEKLTAYTVEHNKTGSVRVTGPGFLMFDALIGPGAAIDSPPSSRTNFNFARGSRFYEDMGIGYFEGHKGEGGGFGFGGRGDGEGRRGFGGRREGEGRRNFEDRNSGSSTNDPKFIPLVSHDELAVPAAECPALDLVIEDLGLRGRTNDALKVLQDFFATRFKYSMWQSTPRDMNAHQTPLSRFLLTTRSGHCEYFATATVLLLRRLGIPTRYATGYAVHEESGSGYVVRLSDAHAWTLVWDEAHKQWFDFETTPSSWIEVEKSSHSPLRWLKDAWGRFVFEFSKIRNGQSNIRQYLLWIILPGMAMLLYQIAFRRGRKRRRDKKNDAVFLEIWPGLDSDFYQLEKMISARGVMRGSAEPLNLWLQRVEKFPGMSSLQEPLRALIRLHYRHRFDPQGLNAIDRESLKAETRRCLELLARTDS